MTLEVSPQASASTRPLNDLLSCCRTTINPIKVSRFATNVHKIIGYISHCLYYQYTAYTTMSLKYFSNYHEVVCGVIFVFLFCFCAIKLFLHSFLLSVRQLTFNKLQNFHHCQQALNCLGSEPPLTLLSLATRPALRHIPWVG